MHRAVGATFLLLMLSWAAVAQFQPVDGPDTSDVVVREDIVPAGSLEGAQRIVRFVQVSDAHIIDDDAPAPMRVEFLDPLGEPFTSAQRPQDEFTDEILDRTIRAINELHEEDALDFVINTGDNIDNQLENELMRFIDNWEGTHTTVGPVSQRTCVPDGQSSGVDDDSNDRTDQCTSLPEALAADNEPLARGLPWFSAFGNHDGLIQGNVPIEPTFNDLADRFGRTFIDQQQYVGMHFRAGTQCLEGAPTGDARDDHGHGFAFAKDRLCDDDPDNDGYYAFDVRGVRFIVLDTVNDDFVTGNENLQGQFHPQQTAGFDLAGGYSEGSLDPAQFAWLLDEVDRHRDQLVVIFSHHTINSMFTEPTAAACCGPDGESLEELLTEAGYKTGAEIQQALADRPNVVAWIGGHTHKHNIEAKQVIGAQGPGFWNIESSSLIDRPHEARAIEVWATPDGKGFLLMRGFTHDHEASRALAATDDQHPDGSGDPDDQDVLLWFDVPAQARLTPQPSLPRFLVLDQVAPQRVNGTHGLVGEPVTLAYRITDNLFQEPVQGLDVQATIHHADLEDFQEIHVDVDALMEEGPAGVYEITFTPTAGATHFVGILATDPSNEFPSADEATSLAIRDPDAGAKPEGKDSPLPWGLVVVGLALAAWRRR